MRLYMHMLHVILSGHSCLSQNIHEKEREIERWILSGPQHQQKRKKV